MVLAVDSYAANFISKIKQFKYLTTLSKSFKKIKEKYRLI